MHIIGLIGLVDEHMGLVAWNADGTGPEAAVAGRAFETPLGTITHHAYSASPDYDRIDPESTGGLRGTRLVEGFPRFGDALAATGTPITDLTVSLPVATEAPGEFHHDENHLETRTLLSDQPTTVQLGGEPMLRLPIVRSQNTIDWGVARFEDSVHTSESSPVRPTDASADSSPAVRHAAAALLSDVRGGPVTLHMGGVAIRFDKTFAGNGRRDGIYVDITEARLESNRRQRPEPPLP